MYNIFDEDLQLNIVKFLGVDKSAHVYKAIKRSRK